MMVTTAMTAMKMMTGKGKKELQQSTGERAQRYGRYQAVVICAMVIIVVMVKLMVVNLLTVVVMMMMMKRKGNTTAGRGLW